MMLKVGILSLNEFLLMMLMMPLEIYDNFRYFMRTPDVLWCLKTLFVSCGRLQLCYLSM